MQDLLGPPSPASFPHLMTQQMRGLVVTIYEALCGDQLDVMGKQRRLIASWLRGWLAAALTDPIYLTPQNIPELSAGDCLRANKMLLMSKAVHKKCTKNCQSRACIITLR
jgi:hypothetical protein